ncbi:TBC1 domain family member 10A [Blattella germanica]|nr:TBC1 domain family member 10A [Blattella germanica]
MLSNWERCMTKNYKKVRERCRKGIPPSVRPRAWLYLCGGKLLLEQRRNLYAQLAAQDGDPRWVDDIRKDLHRQFPYHEMFVDQDGHGQRDLFHVLKAYSILNTTVGYCQAQAPLAAFLLMHMPAEQAFWCLVSICDKYLAGYYSQGMVSLKFLK